MLRSAFACALMATPFTSLAALHVGSLRTEYLKDPIGIQETAPRFFWSLRADEQDQRQSAYRILVASTPDRLAKGQADLWDSGKVNSNKTFQVEYEGKPLGSRQKAYWQVQVWDRAAVKTTSAAAKFEMGLLKPGDWSGRWIGMPSPGKPDLDTSNAHWLWYPEGEPQRDAPGGTRWFRRTFTLPQGKLTGTMAIAVDDRFEAWLNGKRLGSGVGWTAYTVLDLTPALKAGQNELTIIAVNDHSRAGLLAIGHARSGSSTVPLNSDAHWLSFNEAPTATNAVPARQLAPVGGQPYGSPRYADPATPSPFLRRAFRVTKPIKAARIYASAKGLYELQLNGKKVGKSHLVPGWTDYNKRIQYQTYDVTSELTPGDHTLGMILGDGWYCGHVAWAGRQNYGRKPMGLAQLEIEYTDGSRQVMGTDQTWQVAFGPIVSNDLLMGEHYDATLAPTGWTKPEVAPLGAVPLVAQPNQPCEVLDVLVPKKITNPSPGTYIFDLGQNMVGHARLQVSGPRGTKVQLRHAEVLNPDGTIYTTNLRNAKATDTYVLSGNGVEAWEPKFTFHGFRYVEVTGFPGVPTLDAIRGVVVGSAMPKVGNFATSSVMLNQLQHNIFWGQRGNYVDIPTDCPQRDERLGWMGDAQIFVKTATFNNDIAAFMTKWTQDVEDAQSEEGSFADVAPRLGVGPDGAPGWGDAGVIVPWTIYEVYGDTRLLGRRFESMRKWVDFVHKNNPDLIWTKRVGNNYGDWLNVQEETPKDVIATAYFAHSADLVARSARVLASTSKTEAERTRMSNLAIRYGSLFDKIKQTFNASFVAPDGLVKGNTQTGYLLALNFDLLPARVQPLAADHLRKLIMVQRNGHLSTGFLGCGYINPVLTRFGSTDIAYRLLTNETYPGWLYSVKNGATTIWERWDGWTDTKGFQDPGMNSFNHYAFGSVGEWMYSTVAGMDVDHQTVRVAPTPGGGLLHASADHWSIHGRVETKWELAGGNFSASVITPPGRNLILLELPASIAPEVRINKTYIQPTIRDGKAIYRLNGGRYRITSPIALEWRATN